MKNRSDYRMMCFLAWCSIELERYEANNFSKHRFSFGLHYLLLLIGEVLAVLSLEPVRHHWGGGAWGKMWLFVAHPRTVCRLYKAQFLHAFFLCFSRVGTPGPGHVSVVFYFYFPLHRKGTCATRSVLSMTYHVVFLQFSQTPILMMLQHCSDVQSETLAA